MFIYILNLLAVCFWAVLITSLKIKNKAMVFLVIISIQIFLLSALRHINVGADTGVYVRRFSIIADTYWGSIFDLSEVVDFEIGFIILNKLIGTVYDNERFFLVIISAIIIFSISKYIYKNSKIAWLSFFLFIALGFWGSSINVLRQFIAIAILLPTIKHVENRNLFKFVFHVIIASFFHISALAFFVIYPLSKIKITRLYITLIIIVGIITNFFAPNLLNYVIDFFGYQQHADRIGEGSGTGMLVMLIMITIAALIYRKSAIRKGESYDIYIHILLVGLLLNILALNFDLAGRAMIYFTIHNIILIPNILYSINKKIDRFVGIYIVLVGTLYFYFFRLLPSDVSSVVPYMFMEF